LAIALAATKDAARALNGVAIYGITKPIPTLGLFTTRRYISPINMQGDARITTACSNAFGPGYCVFAAGARMNPIMGPPNIPANTSSPSTYHPAEYVYFIVAAFS